MSEANASYINCYTFYNDLLFKSKYFDKYIHLVKMAIGHSAYCFFCELTRIVRYIAAVELPDFPEKLT